jgi:hypothetical protein
MALARLAARADQVYRAQRSGRLMEWTSGRGPLFDRSRSLKIRGLGCDMGPLSRSDTGVRHVHTFRAQPREDGALSCGVASRLSVHHGQALQQDALRGCTPCGGRHPRFRPHPPPRSAGRWTDERRFARSLATHEASAPGASRFAQGRRVMGTGNSAQAPRHNRNTPLAGSGSRQ